MDITMAFVNYFLATDMLTNTVQYFWLIDTYVSPLVTCFSCLKISRYHLFAFAAFYLCHVNSKHFNYGRRWPLYDATVNKVIVIINYFVLSRNRWKLNAGESICALIILFAYSTFHLHHDNDVYRFRFHTVCTQLWKVLRWKHLCKITRWTL